MQSRDSQYVIVDYTHSHIYFDNYNSATQRSSIERAHFDGGNRQVIVPRIPTPQGLAIDGANNYLFWSQQSLGIFRSRLDGSESELIFFESSSIDLSGIAVDPFEQKLYWAQQDPEVGVGGSIRRANYDGSNPETLYDRDDFEGLWPTEIAVDPVNKYVYWYSASEGYWSIQRGSYDGTDRNANIAFMENVEGLALYYVPEPSTVLLAGMGVFCLAVMFLRRGQRAPSPRVKSTHTSATP